jgi:hypothetical protein
MTAFGPVLATGLVYARPREGAAGAATTDPTPMRGNYRVESSVARPGESESKGEDNG